MAVAMSPSRSQRRGSIVHSMVNQAISQVLYRSIVIGQAKILPIIQEKKQNAIQNILSLARELHKNVASHTNSQAQLLLEDAKEILPPAKVTSDEAAVKL